MTKKKGYKKDTKKMQQGQDWDKAYRIASSKTLLRFRCVRAEHSMYL